MILTDSTNNIYTQYMLIDGAITSLGTTTIDLSNYLLVSDFNTQISDYAKKTEVVSQSDVVNDLTTVSSSTVLNTQALKELLDEINDRLDKDEQVILLLNRRGYSTTITCKACGEVIKCPNCDISLTYHKTSEMLRCHYCGYATKKYR